MEIHKLNDMVKGWFVGDFNPTLHSTHAFEVAVKYYKVGDREEIHVHKVATEYTVIVTGTVRMSNLICNAGDIIIVYPGEYTDFEALTDASTTVVKLPSVKGDKYVRD